MRPLAVLFDIGDTILEERRFSLEAGIEAIVGENHDSVVELSKNFRAELLSSHRLNRELYLPAWLCTCLPDCTEASIQKIEDLVWAAAVTLAPAPNVGAALFKLQQDGVQIAAISNAFFSGRALSAELEKHGLGHFFRFVLSSADIGLRKPHPAIFQAALSRLEMNPESAWFVGDTMEEDIVGAVAAGLQPFLLSKIPSQQPLSSKVPVARDWIEFKGLYEATH